MVRGGDDCGSEWVADRSDGDGVFDPPRVNADGQSDDGDSGYGFASLV